MNHFFKRRVHAVTSHNVEAAPPPSAAVEKEIEQKSLVLLRERYLANNAAVEIQRRISSGAVDLLLGDK